MPSFSDHSQPHAGDSRTVSDYTRAMLMTEFLADHLPQLPWYLRTLQCALEDTSTDLRKVCDALASQPQVRANFVRIAGIAEPVRPIRLELEHHVVLLGKQRVWTTAIAAFLLNELNGVRSSAAKKEAAAIALVEANQRLALRADDAPEQAYVEGVLSIAGLLPLIDASCLGDEVPDWLEISPDAIRRQQQVFGTDCLELGRWIRLLWRLPLAESCMRKPGGYSQTEDSPSFVKSLQAATPVPNSGANNLILFTTKGSL